LPRQAPLAARGAQEAGAMRRAGRRGE